MQIIAYGYKLPELSDKDFWESYNFDISRLSTHNHDGNNSAHLAPGAAYPYLVQLLAADWTLGIPPPAGPTLYYYDWIIPVPWMMTWPDGTQAPVQATIRNPEGTIIYLKQSAIRIPLTDTWGFKFETTVPLDCNIEII